MKILVDADACPVKELIVEGAKARGLAVVMVCDNSHEIDDGYSKVITVDRGADSTDVALVNLVKRGDVVVTQDFGVAAMALSKGAAAISQNGMVYDNSNLDRLLFERFLGGKLRRAGGRTRGPKRRTRAQDEAFRQAFAALLDSILGKRLDSE